MQRRHFLATTGALGVSTLGLGQAFAESPAGQREYYLLEQYQLDTEEQKNRFDAFMKDAAIPALNKLGVKPVGVFYPRKELGPAYVLLRHASVEVLVGRLDKLLADADFKKAGSDMLDATSAAPGFKRLESSLMISFKGLPVLEQPVKGEGRVFQLRIYESPSVATAKKKIEMFNDAGEIPIFRNVGLNPVFFGETLVGGKAPNLTYMLGFESADAQQAAWTKFRTDPGWLKLRAMPEYADKTILCGITNLLLKPAPYSQI